MMAETVQWILSTFGKDKALMAICATIAPY